MIVSIIIPTYHDWDRLSLCIKALEKQSFPLPDFEIIVVNNDPEDVPPLSFHIPKNCILISEGKPGSYAARNTGLEHSKGDIIGFTDSDCIPDKDWIKAGVDFLREHSNIKRVTGPIEIFSKLDKPTLVEYHDFVYAFPQDPESKSGTCVTANLFTYKDVFKKVGLFNSNTMSGGDIEWGRRANACGQILAFSEQVKINHPARANYSEIFRKAKRVGKGQVIFSNRDVNFRKVLYSFINTLRPKTWEWKKINRYKRPLPLVMKIGVFLIRNYYLLIVDFYRTINLFKILK